MPIRYGVNEVENFNDLHHPLTSAVHRGGPCDEPRPAALVRTNGRWASPYKRTTGARPSPWREWQWWNRYSDSSKPSRPEPTTPACLTMAGPKPISAVLVALFTLSALFAAVHGLDRFIVQGRVYCDTCRFGFETKATTYVAGIGPTLTVSHALGQPWWCLYWPPSLSLCLIGRV